MSGEYTLYTLEEIQEILRGKCGFETLPYLDTLRWVPTTAPGATEKLQIGTRDEEKVFACFDLNRSSIYQLTIFQEDGEHETTEIVKKDMASVQFFEPFSYWMSTKENSTRLAQRFRTFLRACFVLRGHAAGSSVVIDMSVLPRVVSVIETGRKRQEMQEHSAKRGASTSRRMSSTSEDITLLARRQAPPNSSQDVVPPRRIDVSYLNTHATNTSTQRSRDTRETSSDTSEAMEEDILDLDYGTANNARGREPVNRPASMRRNGKFGMFSGPPLAYGRLGTRGSMRRISARITARSASRTVIQPEQSEDESPSVAREETREVTTSQHSASPPLNTAIDADTPENSPPASVQQGSRSSSPTSIAQVSRPVSSTAEAREPRADRVQPSPIVSSPGTNENTTSVRSDRLDIFAPLTDAGRACFAIPVFQPPDQQTCRECATVNNDIGASQERINTHRELMAQHEIKMAALKDVIATITAEFEDQESKITHRLTETNQALLSSTAPSDMVAYVAALNQATQQANVAQTEISKVESKLTNKTTELQKQIEGLAGEVHKERITMQQVQLKKEAAETRKRELEDKGGQGLAFAIGREIERNTKRRRVQ